VQAVEASFGLTEIMADVDSQDWNYATTDAIVAAAGTLQSGGIILMHDWPPNTIAAIPQIVANLSSRGLCAGMISPTTGRAVAPDSGTSTTTTQSTTTTTVPTTTTRSTTTRSTTTSPVTTSTTRSTTTTTTDGGAGTCSASYALGSSWSGGFVATVQVTAGGSAVNGWQVSLTLPSGSSITNIWNGSSSGTSGVVTVSNLSYNGLLGAGQSTSFGFQGSGSGTAVGISCTAL
jgi:endo-1,4-beta-xylanase